MTQTASEHKLVCIDVLIDNISEVESTIEPVNVAAHKVFDVWHRHLEILSLARMLPFTVSCRITQEQISIVILDVHRTL